MFDVHVEINGEKVDGTDLRGALITKIVDDAKKVASECLNPAEQAQLKIKVVGDSFDDLTLNFNGPDEILAKISKAMKK